MDRPAPASLRIGACPPESLARLGPVLCLYRASETHVLSGLAWATRVQPVIRIDSDGPCESLRFLDAALRPCWQLCLLPDSDFLAWDDAVSNLGAPISAQPMAIAHRRGGAAIELAVGNPLWRACALQLHVVSMSNAPGRLATAPVALSQAGERAAERIARAAGTDFVAHALADNFSHCR